MAASIAGKTGVSSGSWNLANCSAKECSAPGCAAHASTIARVALKSPSLPIYVTSLYMEPSVELALKPINVKKAVFSKADTAVRVQQPGEAMPLRSRQRVCHPRLRLPHDGGGQAHSSQVCPVRGDDIGWDHPSDPIFSRGIHGDHAADDRIVFLVDYPSATEPLLYALARKRRANPSGSTRCWGHRGRSSGRVPIRRSVGRPDAPVLQLSGEQVSR